MKGGYLVIFVSYRKQELMRYIAIVIFIILALPVLAQQPTRTELEKRRQSIMESIKQTEEQLEATKRDKNATIGQLRALQNKLAERQKLINNINEEIGQINNNIHQSSQEVNHLKENLGTLKLRYAQSVRYAYKSRSSYDMLAFLFSSNDFNEALRRIKYLKKYRDYRKDQANQIRITQGEIVKKIDVLNNAKAQKDVLLLAEMQQKTVLQDETNETNKVVKDLKSREKDLISDIEKNKKAAKQLDRAVAEIIRREIEIARKKAEEEARKRAEEERKRKEEEARLAANRPTSGMSVNTGSGTRTFGGNPATTNTSPATNGNRPATTTGNAPASAVTATRPAPKPVANYNYSLTPEAAALSTSFENNRGKLPWPVEKGFISDAFGKHQHPVAEKVMIDNNGIDIRTSPNATARAVFDGVVTKVFYISGRNWNVLISHGRYYTLYSMLENVSVKADQQVHTKQSIGTVGVNDDGETIMNFQVWKEGSKLDPSGWIAR